MAVNLDHKGPALQELFFGDLMRIEHKVANLPASANAVANATLALDNKSAPAVLARLGPAPSALTLIQPYLKRGSLPAKKPNPRSIQHVYQL